MKLMMTGAEIMERYGVSRGWLGVNVIEGALQAYHPTTHARYVNESKCLKKKYRKEIVEGEEVEILDTCYTRYDEYPIWPDAPMTIFDEAMFMTKEIDAFFAKIEGRPLPSERITDLESQLAEARQENEDLRAELEKLQTEVAEAEELAAADPENLTDKQVLAFKVILMRHEGKTIKEVGEELFPNAQSSDAQIRRVYRAQKQAKALLSGGDKPAS